MTVGLKAVMPAGVLQGKQGCRWPPHSFLRVAVCGPILGQGCGTVGAIWSAALCCPCSQQLSKLAGCAGRACSRFSPSGASEVSPCFASSSFVLWRTGVWASEIEGVKSRGRGFLLLGWTGALQSDPGHQHGRLSLLHLSMHRGGDLGWPVGG